MVITGRSKTEDTNQLKSIPAAAENESGQKQAVILLVDDRPEDLIALEAILADMGSHLLFASSGREALRRLLDWKVDLVLLDVRMPGLDGFETARLMRGSERSRATPII